MKALFLLSSLLAVSAMAQASDRPEEFVMIGMRTLEGAELARYRSIEAEISCAFEGRGAVPSALETTQRLEEMISSGDLLPAAKHSLRAKVREQAFAGTAEPLALARELLVATDHELRFLALDHLLNADAWAQREDIRRTLHQLLADSATRADERIAIVWLFASAGLFDSIRETALALATDHTDASLAHGVAQAVVGAHADDLDTLVRFAVSDARALREEAARFTYRCGDARPASATALTTAMLTQIAGDRSEPEWVRGEAIETLALCPGDPATRAALVGLLNRSSWFFGATGQHFPVHSLALVIPPLAGSDDPAIRARLVALRAELPVLRSGEREYVEWVLANALGEHREVFRGPVDP